MDTGIDYTVITPNQPGNPPPNPAGGQMLIPDVTVGMVLGDVSWGFNTSQCGGPPANPAYARLAVPSQYGILNTGRHFLASYKYMIQLDERIGATTGVMGFLKV